MYRSNNSKAKILKGESAYGMIHALASPRVAEMTGLAGYDFIVLDGEHGPGGTAELVACLQAVASTPITPVMRVAPNDFSQVRRALDLGVEGVMVGDVATGEEASEIVSACFYPPRGTRGFSAGTVRATDYGMSIDNYLADGGENLLICLMIESAEGIENVGAIAAVDGVDVIQIGPFDLTFDLGIPGQFDHPRFAEALEKIERGVKDAGKILGGVPLPGLPLETLHERGYRFITMGADVPLLAGALKEALPK
jgi:2-keto-3-deoxy-L-rhamnonate aldolase RhmA